MDIVCRISDIGRSGKSEIDPFGIPGFYGISEIDPFGIPGFYGIVTYFRWRKGNISWDAHLKIHDLLHGSFPSCHSQTLFSDSYVANQIAASVVSHSPIKSISIIPCLP